MLISSHLPTPWLCPSGRSPGVQSPLPPWVLAVALGVLWVTAPGSTEPRQRYQGPRHSHGRRGRGIPWGVTMGAVLGHLLLPRLVIESLVAD